MAQSKLKDPRTCRIFFSSPFSGMEGEREELTRKYFPQIHHLCNSKGVQFVAVDMRWGITSEMTASAQVIRICLRELDRSDMFVGFFGQRYGWHGVEDKALQENFDNAVGYYPWLDNVRDKSVTEIEFLHGHLNHIGEIPTTICFRSKDYDDCMVEEGKKMGDKKRVYKYTAESEHSVNMMKDLKSRVHETKEKSLGVLIDYSTPAEGAEFMFNTIMKHLNEVLLADNPNVEVSKRVNLLVQHDAFLTNRSVMYIGGGHYIREMTKNIDQEIPSSYLVTGPAGSGKSAMLCTWISGIRHNPDYRHVCLVYHFVGYAEDSIEPRSILQRICDEFDFHIDKIQGKESKPKKLEGDSTEPANVTVPDLVQKLLVSMEKLISLEKLPVIVIDGVEKVVKTTKTEKPMFWLPPDIPSKSVIIVSTKYEDTDSITELKEVRKFKVMDIVPMDTNTKKDFIVKSLKESGKELATGQLDKLVQATHADNPLYLKITLNEMVVFGYFRLLDKKIDTLISSESVEQLFEKVLQRLEDDYNVKEHPANLVEQVMCAIYFSRHGVSETELREIFNIPSPLWSPLYFAIDKYIIEQSGLMEFGFTELKECVGKRYLNDDDKRKHYLKCLIDYFEEARKTFPPVKTSESSVADRVTHELPWLWLQLGDKEGLANVLCDIQISDTLICESEYILLDLWRATGLDWEEIADRYIKNIEMKMVDLYLYYEKYNISNVNSPGLFMSDYIINMMHMFGSAGIFKAKEKMLLRHIRILEENIKTGFLKDERKLNQQVYNLACLYVDHGYHDKAFTMHTEILQKRERIVKEQETKGVVDEEDITDLGSSYHGLAVLYFHKEDYDKAEELLLKTLEIQEPLNDVKHDQATYLNLGNVYLRRGEYDKALEYSMKTLKIQEELNYGHLPPEIGETLSNIGLCHRRLGDLNEAEKYYHRSLEIKRNTVGNDHVLCTVTLMNLSVIEKMRKNMDKAVEYLEEALRIFKVCDVPENTTEYLQTRENMILYLVNEEKYEEALDYFLPFFKVVVKYDRFKSTFPSLHTDLVKYMYSKQMYDDALWVTLELLKAGVGCDINYIYLDMLDSIMSGENERPERPDEFSLNYAHKMWPDNGNIVRQIIKFHLIPADDYKGVVDMMEEFHSVSELGVEIYNATNIWLSEDEQVSDEMLIAINETAFQKYPDSPYSMNFLRNIANGCIRIQQRDKAIPYLLKILEKEPDDSQVTLVTAQSAFLVNDIEMGKKYCHIAMDRFAEDEEVVTKAKTLLDMVEEGMPQQDVETSNT